MIKRLIGLDFFPVNDHFQFFFTKKWSWGLQIPDLFKRNHRVMFLTFAKKDVFAK